MAEPVKITIGRKPLKERERGSVETDGIPFPKADPITLPDEAKGIHNVFCSADKCGFYTVSPYTVDQWESIGRTDKVFCPLCGNRMSNELIAMPMRVTDKVPVAPMIGDPTGLLGKGRHERWDFGGGAGYYNRIVVNKGERDEKAWEKMQAWAKGGSATDVEPARISEEADSSG